MLLGWEYGVRKVGGKPVRCIIVLLGFTRVLVARYHRQGVPRGGGAVYVRGSGAIAAKTLEAWLTTASLSSTM